MSELDIVSVVECQDCQSIIESKHRHDFRYCRCSKVFIDGGRDYLRYGWTTKPPVVYSLHLKTGVLTKLKE